MEMLRRVGVLGLLVVLSSLCACDATAQTSWRDSLAILNEQIRLQPTSTDLRLRKAAVNIELRQWEYAVDEYGRVLELDPKNLAAHFFRAYAHSQLRHYDQARSDYEAIIAVVPRHFEAQLGLAMTFRSMGKRTETLDRLNLLVEQHPDSALAWAARAGYEAELEQLEPALYDWDEALRRDPQNPEFKASRNALLRRIRRQSH